MQCILKTHQLLCFALCKLLNRNLGPLGNHIGDVCLCDMKHIFFLILLPLFIFLVQLLLLLLLLLLDL